MRAKEFRRPARALHQRERVDRSCGTSEQRDRIGAARIAGSETPLAYRDQRECEQR
jgi:hypothetical protein